MLFSSYFPFTLSSTTVARFNCSSFSFISAQLRYDYTEIQKRYQRHKNYMRVVANMESQFPEASQQQLSDNRKFSW